MTNAGNQQYRSSTPSLRRRALENRSRTCSPWDIIRRIGVRFYGFTFFFLLVGIGAFSVVLRVKMSQSSIPRGGQLPSSGAVPIHTGILMGYITSLQLPVGFMNVTWIVDGCSTNTTAPTTPPCTNSDYFIDSNAWELYNTGTATPDIKYRAADSGPDPVHDLYDPTVTTIIPIYTADFQLNWARTDQAYPLDLYFFRTFYASCFADTNQTASVGGVYVFGNVPTFTYSIVSRSYQSNDTRPDSLLWVTDITFTRSSSTKAFCLIIVATNWLITVAVAWLTWTTIVGRRRIARELYSVPLTALFAVPPLRSAMPGVPASNAMIDYVGTIPNVMVIGACTISIILSSLMRDVDGLYPLHGAGLDLTDLDGKEVVDSV